MSSLIQSKTTPPLLISLALLCFALLPWAEAVVPSPDGGYPNFTTVEGTKALQNLNTGAANTAIGWYSLFSVTTAGFNTGVGAGTLALNTADRNTATGAGALLSNSTGHDNTASGAFCLLNNTTGHENTAHGGGALFHNGNGSSNTAMGINALFTNMTGSGNTAIGGAALYNTISDSNTAVGLNALFANTNGNGNTAIGTAALLSNTAGSDNIALGAGAGGQITIGSDNIDIGNPGGAESSAIRIGLGQIKTFIAGISGIPVTGQPVVVDISGQLGVAPSSRRFKEKIEPMEGASETLLGLKPVTFRYKKEIDSRGTPQFGLVAEEVEAVNPDLVVHDKEGKVNTVRYDAVNAMLLNEFLKEHRRVEEQQATIGQLKSNATKQEATISELRKDMGVLTAQLKEQAAQIQKVNARIEANELTSQLVSNGQ